MKNNVFRNYRIFLICLLTTMSIPILADSMKINQCTEIKSNMKRLACFDNMFGTPIPERNINEKIINSPLPKIVSDIFLLAQNNTDTIDFHQDELQIALNSEDKNQAAIYIACKDNITRFQIALNTPVKKNPLKIEIQDYSTGKIASNINWQNTEHGYLLDAGRGLYAIQQLKSILYIDTFNIILPEEKKNFIFKNNGLASLVAPIREECGW